MEEANKKIALLEKENELLKQRLALLEKSRNPLGEIPGAQPRPALQDTQAPRHTFLNNPDILSYLKTILGYNIEQVENRFILRSVYAFCEEDVFEIEVSNNRLIFKSTDYLSEHQEAFNVYVKNGKSYCAFFAAVTLDLFNKKTFG